MSSRFQISIDPGLSGTGFAVWQDGECLEVGTLRPPKDDDSDQRIDWLYDKLKEKFAEICKRTDTGAAIETVAIEKFQRFVRKPNMLAMMKCADARRACRDVARLFTREVVSVDKGRAPKTDARWLAKRANVEGSEHAKDAYHLGIIAGFDRTGR